MNLIVPIAMITVAAVAAATDARTGLIPNWLTLPPLLAAPLLYLMLQGAGGLGFSLAGALACGIVPYLLFRFGSMGGGDVKLLAALGAIGGTNLGLELELIGLTVAAAYGVVLLLRRGQLGKTLLSSLFLVVNVFLPASKRRPMPTTEMIPLRLGVPLFVGTVAALVMGSGAVA
jgi:prepilin peptidase CpaA